MPSIDYYRGRRITVVGLGKSGVSCCLLLKKIGALVCASDSNDNQQLRAEEASLKAKDIKVELGANNPGFILASDIIVVSPGVPNDAPVLAMARSRNIEILSEIEVSSSLCEGKIIAVTGTSGKTTVTSLLAELLKADKRGVFLGGNIGVPFASFVDKVGKNDFVCLEVSSFQLENIKEFKPRIALILNFSLNHLDRHKDAGEYLAAKKKIFLNQDGGDYLILNKDDAELRKLPHQAKSKIRYFQQCGEFNANQAAVIAIADILNIGRNKAMAVFASFKGIEHRFEEVARINGIIFINDSKATTVTSTIWGLNNIPGPAILIAGGRDKKCDYKLLKAIPAHKLKMLILIGEARDKIKSELSDTYQILESPTIEDAVNLAYSKAKPGDSVLLSPMCSSFDMFDDYAHRGRVFKKAVGDLSIEALK